MVSPPSPHTKPDRAYHHGDLRNALIDAGLTALEAQDASELSLRALARELGVSANGQLRAAARASGPTRQSQPNPVAIDEATMLRAIARWSLVHGLSHLMLEGQLSFFGPGAASEQLAQAVLMASGMGSAPQPLGKPSTNASS